MTSQLIPTNPESVKEKFAPEKMVDTIEAVYRKLLEKKTL
jgi:hypothetical protein